MTTATATAPRPATPPGATVPLSPFALEVEAGIRDIYRILERTGTLSPSGVGNASQRVPGAERIVVGGFLPYTAFGDGVARTVEVDLASGEVVAGSGHDGLLEVLPLYVAAHRLRPEVGSLIHTHSPWLTSWAIARRPLPIRYQALLRHGERDIPVTRYGARYEPEPIIETLTANPGTPALLHGNHGPFVFAKDLRAAAHLLVGLEEGAHFTLNAEILGGAKDFPAGTYAAFLAGRPRR